MNTFFTSIKNKLSGDVGKVIIALILLYLVVEILGIPCTIKYFTGVSCAGCGMSRAYRALMSFDIAGAFYYHPLFFIPPLWVLMFLLYGRVNKRILTLLFALSVIIYLAVYVFRMLNPADSVVVFEPENGLYYRWARGLVSLVRGE